MKTQNDKLKFVMEAAGECCHEWENFYINVNQANMARKYTCKLCGDSGDGHVHLKWKYPSPTDMNNLTELAEKLVWDYRIYFSKSAITCKYQVEVWLDAYTREDEMVRKFANTPQEALLTALFVAKGGLEDE